MANWMDNLSRLVAAEAGNQGIEGQKGVAATIMNRMASPQFPSSFEGVATQQNQFEPWGKFGSFDKMPSLTPDQNSQLMDFAKNYSAETDPTGGALFFQNPAITSERGTQFGQKGGVTIGDHVFSRTYGDQEVPTTPPAYANNTPLSPLEIAKQNILNLTKGQRSEAQGKELVNYGNDEILAASEKFNQAIGNLNQGFSGQQGQQQPLAQVPLEQIDMAGAAGYMPQTAQQQPAAKPMAMSASTGNNISNNAMPLPEVNPNLRPPKPKKDPNSYTGATPEIDKDGKYHYKSFADMLSYNASSTTNKPEIIKGDGKKFIPKVDINKLMKKPDDKTFDIGNFITKLFAQKD